MTEWLLPQERKTDMLSVLTYIREGMYFEAIISIISKAFVVFCCLPIHELAHGFVANKCGDHTAKTQGRLTMNPFAHLDPIGTIMIFLFGIGYARPVPVNPARLKHPRRDMALIALAGPVTNFLMGFVCIFIYYALVRFLPQGITSDAICYFFSFAATVNVSLAVFNMLPIPPLDGAKVLGSVLPDKIYFKIMQYEKYIMIGLMVLLFLGVFSRIISAVSEFMINIISIIPRLIFFGV